ncbi:polycomb group protein Psc [Anopheles bellator]|uniref:polycomb group protein Psc n=1 Tax=Anopheles bellator TaxID=139047 RepID=UPI00264829C0|nr:polycomb group protein Psc [Anopheles bellator]
MVLLPSNADEDVTRPGTSPSASTELASEAAPVKVATTTANSNPVARPSSAPKDDRVTGTQETPPPSPPSAMASGSEDVVPPSVTSQSSTQSSARRSVPFLARPLSPYRPSHAPLSLVNPCITCNLCKGYLIDATTIVECLHSFCHSCIMKHLRTEQYCPQCEMMINKAKPNIKPDATLQAIVYKLVPGLYENELRRRRAFYRLHPEMAAIATPEQRGDDTEHLIFGPNEKISLSLEYAEKELAQDNEELLTPKYLLCPALFSVAHLKKFIVFKYGISERQFCVEIMYKVKTIILPDYYTLMDVAYIYTWKRDAPMKYFYRIRTTEVYPVELTDIPFHRRPSVASGGDSSSSETVVSKDDDEDDKENISHHQQRGAVTAPLTTDTAPAVPSHGVGVKSAQRRRSELPNGAGSADQQQPPTVKPTLSTNQQRPGTPDPSRKLGGAAEPTNGSTSTSGTPMVARKNEAIKLKIELNKNKYISILQSPQADIPVARPDKPEKVKRKKSDNGGGSSSPSAASSSSCGNGSELKMKIGKIKYPAGPAGGKEGKGGRKSSPPYKVEQLSLGCFAETVAADEGKKASKNFPLSSGSSAGKKLKSPKYHHPIVLKIDQRTPDMATSTLKFGMSPKDVKSKTPSPPPPLPPLPPSPPEVVNKFQDAKSQFLNEFNLTPINTRPDGDGDEKPRESNGGSRVSAARTDATPKAGGSSPPSKSLPSVKAVATNGTTTPASPTTSLKRKPKDCAQRPGPKKPKLSDEEVKALVEKTVAENINSPRGCMLSMSYFKPTTAPPAGRPPSISPPITGDDFRSAAPKKAKISAPAPKPPRSTFMFRTPMMPPPAPPSPPIVCASNIPAVKPTQQIVIPAPIPLKPDPVEYPRKEKAPVADEGLMKQPLVIPQRRPTMPTKLPTSNATSTNNTPKGPPSAGVKPKPLELKRAQNNPSININPPARDTEISKLRPEDIKKNVKVYGPPADAPKPAQLRTDGFAVPTRTAPKPSSSSTSSSASSSASALGGHNKVRPVNYLNYAQFNSKTAPAGSRTPIPSYSPSYSPDSPQYSPNFSISTKQFRYANPLAYSNYLLSDRDRKSGGGELSVSPPLSLSPATSPASSPSPPHLGDGGTKPVAPKPATDRKRPASAMSPETTTTTTSPTNSTTGELPAEKKPIVQSLLTKINIPSSLSITLATEEDEVARQTARKMRESDPAHNHIQIVKLPEIPITEVALSTSGPSTTASVSVSSGLAVTITPAQTTAQTTNSTDRRTPPQQPTAMKLSPGSTAGKKDDAKVVSPGVPATSSRKSPEAGPDGYQQKFLDSIDKKLLSGKGGNTAAPAASSGLLVKYGGKEADTSSTVVTVASPSPAGKTSAPSTTTSRFKHPNATVFSNGIVMLSSYPEGDLATKGGKGARPSTTTASPTTNTTTSTTSNTSSSSSSKGLMPPPKVAGLAGAPKPPATSDGGASSAPPPLPHPKAISPPIISKKSITPALSLHKTKPSPPPNVPSMASMGPMFGIQMKSDANAAILAASSGSSSSLQNTTTTSTAVRRQSVGGSSSVPRRKIVPTNNSTSLVPLKTSPPSSGSKPSPTSGSNSADYITLTPQTSKAAHPMLMPPPPPVSASSYGPSNTSMLYEMLKAQHHQNQQQAAFASLMDSTLMMKHYNLLMQQLSQSTHNGQGLLGQDSLTITTSPVSGGGSSGGKPSPAAAAAHHHQAMLQAHHLHQQQMQQMQQQHQAQQALNSLTVTAIRSPNGTTTSAGSGSPRPTPPKALGGGLPMPSRGPGGAPGGNPSNGTVS